MLADTGQACVAQDPSSARGSCPGVRVCAPCRLSPQALASNCSCLHHGTSVESGPSHSKMCDMHQWSA